MFRKPLLTPREPRTKTWRKAPHYARFLHAQLVARRASFAPSSFDRNRPRAGRKVAPTRRRQLSALSRKVVVDIISEHALGPQSTASKALIAGSGSGGLGDQVAGLLGALALAIASRRRLELSPESTSLLEPSFELPFNSRYTGQSDWPDLAAAAYTGMQDARAEEAERVEVHRRGS